MIYRSDKDYLEKHRNWLLNFGSQSIIGTNHISAKGAYGLRNGRISINLSPDLGNASVGTRNITC